MTRFVLFTQYLFLSAVNGTVPLIIALLFSVSGVNALLIWGAATVASFMLICLVCLRSAMFKMISASDSNGFRGELEKATVLH
jgi:hypothetical protein